MIVLIVLTLCLLVQNYFLSKEITDYYNRDEYASRDRDNLKQ